jgi:hypothetical protein
MIHYTAAIFLSFSLLLSGCTLLHRSTAPTNTSTVSFAIVDTEDLSLIPADCTITSNHNTHFKLKGNPAKFKAKEGQTQLMVSCSKPGYYQKELAITPGYTLDYNDLSTLSGFVVDAFDSNAGSFPAHIVVLMEKVNPYETPALSNDAYKKTMAQDPFFQGAMSKTD